ncbi:MAG: hypothetical protein ACE5L6_01685 [Candidatus Bathyarchaeia archaeon]
MKLSSILMVCSGLINAGIAGIFYYFAFISYLGSWLYGAGWQIIIGAMFTIVSIGSFLGSKHLDGPKSAVGGIGLMMVALVELFFSFPFLFFAFAGGHMSLLEYGIPLLFASILLLVGIALRWREIKHRKIKDPRNS